MSACAEARELAALGPDALALTVEHLAHWRKAKGRLKHRLLSQKDVAGLGNIYVDEALWLAQLHPLQRVDRIPPDRLAALVAAIRTVLENSIRSGGTTLRDYRNVADQPGQFARQLQAYGRAHLPCFRCGAALKTAQIAGRTTVFCATCQRRR
jgi:formamidopyrimidine-DNA glycosylase